MRDVRIAGRHAELGWRPLVGDVLIAGQHAGLATQPLAGNALIAGQYDEVLTVGLVFPHFSMRTFLPADWRRIRAG